MFVKSGENFVNEEKGLSIQSKTCRVCNPLTHGNSWLG